ncbi:MAG: hypothetical protein ACLU98_00210 [Desulfovibrio fairfieldensis]
MFTGDASVSAPGAHLALALAPGASKKLIQRISISNLPQNCSFSMVTPYMAIDFSME